MAFELDRDEERGEWKSSQFCLHLASLGWLNQGKWDGWEIKPEWKKRKIKKFLLENLNARDHLEYRALYASMTLRRILKKINCCNLHWVVLGYLIMPGFCGDIDETSISLSKKAFLTTRSLVDCKENYMFSESWLSNLFFYPGTAYTNLPTGTYAASSWESLFAAFILSGNDHNSLKKNAALIPHPRTFWIPTQLRP
jgi:hypothetical protein